MGGTCSSPSLGDEEEMRFGIREADIRKCEVVELLEIPGVDVRIINGSGDEEAVSSGRLVVAELTERQLTVLFVGNAFNDQEGGWYYPMLPQTPVCLSGRSFLTVWAGGDDIFGVKLPKKMPEGEQQLETLIELLTSRCQLEIQKEPGLADKFASKLISGSKVFANAVERGTDRLAQSIRRGGENVRSRVTPAQEEVQIGEGAKLGAAGAFTATGSAVVVTAAFVDGLVDAAYGIAQEATNKNNRNGNTEGPERDPNATGNVPQEDSATKKLGMAAGAAGLKVLTSLMKAGDRLMAEVGEETVATVGYKYGKQAEEVARDGTSAVKQATRVAETVCGRQVITRLSHKADMYSASGMIKAGYSKPSKSNLDVSRPKHTTSGLSKK